MPLATGTRLGPYEVIAPLGAGGMGEVYRARDPRLGRDVAVKVLPADRLSDPVRRARFEQEARAAAALHHPHIVTVHEIESAEGVDFMVMELVAGKTLDALIPRHGMRLGEVLRIAIPLADALAAAHAAGIVHRDLKPANVMVTPEGVVKVLDFGLAKLTQAEPGAGEDDTTLDAPAKLSQPGRIAGTPAYMSPEQASGGAVDARSDVFSFGSVLYEMVTGRRPFAGGSSAETLAALLKEPPKPPGEIVADVPRELERIILHCLRKEPARRFQHVVDVKVELEELKEESDSQALAPTRRARERGPSRRRVLALGTAGILMVAVVAAVALLRLRRPAPPAPSLVPLTATPGSEAQPTFSPAGDQVAFAWDGGQEGNWDIYVKMIGSTETHRLTTDPAVDMWPSWSPDGSQIAFVRTASGGDPGTLHIVSPLGGPDRRVSALPVASGRLSWSPDGRAVATGASLGRPFWRSDLPLGIRVIDVASGESRSITSPDGSTYHNEPALAPDGRHLAYASCVGVFSCHVDVVALGRDGMPAGAARSLTPGIIWPLGLAWTADGASVVYGDNLSGRLWRSDLRGRRPERIEIAGVGHGDAFRPAIAVSRDRLAFVRSGTGGAIYRLEAGRPAQVVTASSLPFWDWNPDLSPDGTRIAFESNRAGAGDEIWLAASDGSSPVQLTHGPGLWQGSPRWSPDGRRIAFDSHGADSQWDVWTIDADGGSPRRVTSSPADDNGPTWSHDGRFLYFSSNRTRTQAVWRVPAAGGREEQLTRTGGGRCAETPDGKSLLFQQSTFGSSPLLEVPVAGGPERTLIDCVPRFGFAVTPAGVYHVACAGDPRGVPLLLRDAATGRDRLLGTLERPGGGLTVSADGRTILYGRGVGEGSDLVLIENFR
jgi:serine/threonine protein kinase